jgi:hypothetical protein
MYQMRHKKKKEREREVMFNRSERTVTNDKTLEAYFDVFLSLSLSLKFVDAFLIRLVGFFSEFLIGLG